MNRARLAAAAALAAALAGALALPLDAPAQQEFVQRMVQWEQETGRTSRLTIYARAAALMPDIGDPQAQALNEAARAPFQTPLEQFGPLFDACQQPLALMESAWGADDIGSFPFASPEDPALNVGALISCANLLAVRAQAFASQGNLDAALSDVATGWLAGYSLENNRDNSFLVNLIGISMRNQALTTALAIIQAGDLSSEQRAKLGQVLTMSPTQGRQTVFESIDRELRIMLEFAVADASVSDDLAPAEGCERAYRAMSEALAAMSRLSRPERPSRQEWSRTIREAAEGCPVLNQGAPDAIEPANRQDLANAKEAVALAALFVWGANDAKGDGAPAASPEEIAAFAGPLANLLTDPMTGQPLAIENRGGASFTVLSAGPDGAAGQGGDDIFVNRP